MHKPVVLGICGGSGSGKTTLLKRLSERFAHFKPSIFSMDNYYLPIEKQQKDKNQVVNFDLPTALNQELLEEDLSKLIAGNPIHVKEYFFNAPPNKNVLITVQPSQFIIVEGLFLFHYKRVSDVLDFSIFVDVEDKVQLDRRLYRDEDSRGYKREDILYQWNNHVLPCYTKYILPYKENASCIYYNDENSEQNFEKLAMELNQSILNEKTFGSI